jgi:RNA-directed DNA polymerase
LVMNLTTPDKIRSLQRKLYCKAKAEPTFRFYQPFGEVRIASVSADHVVCAKQEQIADTRDGRAAGQRREYGSL